jgi:hypothetical protein
MAEDIRSLIIALVLCALWVVVLWQCQRHAELSESGVPVMVQRLLTPRTPDNCPACRSPIAQPLTASALPPLVRPWRERKSRRGRPKRIATQGFACPNRACSYYRITDAQVHALVGDGTHGTTERIQTFRCQACRMTFSARRNTPLYRLNPRPSA